MGQYAQLYTDTPTRIRIFSEGTSYNQKRKWKWYIDGTDANGLYTEDCWSYDSWWEAVEHLSRFYDLYVKETD